MATLKDVAKLANVDVSTVSRALNNTSYVHPDTKARIYEAAKELGYHPNVIAKALRRGKRHTIGVVVPRLHLDIFSEILQSLEAAGRKLGYETIICVTCDDPVIERTCLNRLRNGLIDGIIITGTGKNNRLLRDIVSSGIPIVQLIRRQERSISSVVGDYEAGSFEAVRHLYHKGCRDIGLISGSLPISPFSERHHGYTRAMERYGLTPHICECCLPFFSFDYGYESTLQLLAEVPNLDAILATVDIQGLGAIRALADRRLTTKQVRVISLTGHTIGSMLQTGMTAMEMPSADLGRTAAEMLIKEIEQKGNAPSVPVHLMLSSVLVERESTSN